MCKITTHITIFTHFVHLTWYELDAGDLIGIGNKGHVWIKENIKIHANDIESDGALYGFTNMEEQVKFALKFRGE